MSKWNRNRFSVFTSDEKSVLGLIQELGDFSNNINEEIKNKTDLTGDHKGTWQGLSKPTMSDEGMRSTVEKIQNNFNIVDKYGDIFTLYDNMPSGGVIHILGEIDCFNRELILDKSIKIVGLSNDSTLKNVSINIKSDDVTLSNFKIITDMDNAIVCNTGSYENIKVYDIESKAKAHSFLFEDYNGLVKNVVVENCIARDSINGFISKSKNVSFINCKAFKCGLSFGLVSDNIPSPSQIASCENNNIINCYAAEGTYGLHIYCRDKYNTTCLPYNKNNKVINFTVENCLYPIQVGETSIWTGYKAFKEIEQATFDNIVVNGGNSEWSILVSNGSKCNFKGCKLENKIQQVSAYQCVLSDIQVINDRYVGQKIFNIDSDSAFIDTSIYNIVEIQYNTTNNNVINLLNKPTSTGLINIFIRTNGANNVSFGGFGSNVIDNDNILKTLDFNKGQNITFAYIESIQKFLPILINKNIKYS